MTDTVEALREGDIYRWRYRNPSDNRYHCCSRIAVVKDGVLRDTYWQIGQSFSDGRWFGVDALPKLELTFLGNFSDLVLAKEYDADYYDNTDIVNLNHANSPRGNFYLRKGAVRSQSKMLEVAHYSLARSIANERSAADLSQQLRDAISRIEAGEINGYLPTTPR